MHFHDIFSDIFGDPSGSGPNLTNKLHPNADVDVSHWKGEDGSTTNLYAHLRGDPGDYVYSDELIRPGVFQVIGFGDDTRFDDYYHVLRAGTPIYDKNPAAGGVDLRGTSCVSDLIANVLTPGVVYRMARSDQSLCGPARGSLWSGHAIYSHGIYSTTIAPGYLAGRQGGRSHYFSDKPDKMLGPWDFDLAYKVGAWILTKPGHTTDTIGLALTQGTKVTMTQVATVVDAIIGGSGNLFHASADVRKGWSDTLGVFNGTGITGAPLTAGLPVQVWDSSSLWGGVKIDDLQANSGGMPNLIGREDVLGADGFMGFFGKTHNYHGITTTAPFDTVDPSYPYWTAGTYNTGDHVAHNGGGGKSGFYQSTANGNTNTPNYDDPTGATSHWQLLGRAKTDRMVPAGMTHTAICADDVQDHLRFELIEYSGTLAENPGWGDGAIGDACFYNAIQEIESITQVGGGGLAGGTTIEVKLKRRQGYYRNGTFVPWDPVVGDEIAVRRVTRTGSQNNKYNIAQAYITAVSTTTNPNDTFRYVTDSPPSGPADAVVASPGAYSNVVPFKMTFPEVMRLRVQEALADANVDRLTNGVLYWGSRMPHGALVNYNGLTPSRGNPVPWSYTSAFTTTDIDVTPRYRDPRLLGGDDLAVDSTKGYFWNGQPSAVSPAVGSTPALVTWAERGCMLKADDDALKAIRVDLRARRGVYKGQDAWKDWRVGDNGWQQCEDYTAFETGEVGTCSAVGGKDFNREGSLRIQFVVREPGITAGEDRVRHVAMMDVLPTLLDDLGLTNHQVHDSRDGKSMKRPLFNRALPALGIFRDPGGDPNTGKGIVRPDNKVLRIKDALPLTYPPSIYIVENIAPDPASPVGASDDWGTVDIRPGSGHPDTISTGQLQTLVHQAEWIRTAGWSNVLNRNTFHDDIDLIT